MPGEPGEEGADGVPGVTSGSGAGPTGPQGPQGPASAPIPGADGDDGQLIVIGAAVPGSAGPPGSSGALVLLEQHTASGSAELDFTTGITSTYDTYVFEFSDRFAPGDERHAHYARLHRRRSDLRRWRELLPPPISPGRRPARAKADHQGKARLRSHR